MGYGVAIFKNLEWGCLLDSLVRAYSMTVGTQQLRKIYYILFWPAFFAFIVLQNAIRIYTPYGRAFEFGCPAPGEPLTAPSVCFPANSFLYSVHNVFAIPDTSLLIVGSYLVMTVYWEKKDHYPSSQWSWLPMLWRGAFIFVYIAGQLILQRLNAWQMAVNIALLLLLIGALILVSTYWTPQRLFSIPAPEIRLGEVHYEGWLTLPLQEEEKLGLPGGVEMVAVRGDEPVKSVARARTSDETKKNSAR